MGLHAGGEEVGSRFVVGFIDCREEGAAGAHYGFLAVHQFLDHGEGVGFAVAFFDTGEGGEFAVGARRRETQGADAFGDFVHRGGEFGVLLFKHEVQGAEHRPFDVPVEFVGFEVEGVAVCEDFGEAFGDGFALCFAHANVDAHGLLRCVMDVFNGAYCSASFVFVNRKEVLDWFYLAIEQHAVL